jgi:hypothetical protein
MRRDSVYPGRFGIDLNGGKLRRIWDDLLVRIASSNLELELELLMNNGGSSRTWD